MLNTRLINMSAEKQHCLMEWWNATESAKPVVQRLVSLVSELRLHPESSNVDGMILFIGLLPKFHMVMQVCADVYAELLQVNTTKLFGRI